MALDIEEPQCLIDFFDDANGYYWHHRVLLKNGGGGKWIIVTPTGSVQVADLTAHRVVPLVRNSPYPDVVRVQEIFGFDPVSAEEMRVYRERAAGMATILGFDQPVAGQVETGLWRIADTARDDFGEEVAVRFTQDPANCVVRDNQGLLLVDAVWVPISRVQPDQFDEWRRKKLCGPQRDARLIGDDRDSSGVSFLSFDSAAARSKHVARSGWPHEGPCAGEEYIMSLKRTGRNFLTHDQDWRHKSGISDRSAVAREHKLISEMLHLALTVDQVNPCALSSLELAVRQLIRQESAVRRNPKQPDFDGLDNLINFATDESGALATSGFTAWFAARQKDQAFVMKQQRQYQEEKEAIAKKNKNHKPPIAGGGDG